jgi:hypothetical protein
MLGAAADTLPKRQQLTAVYSQALDFIEWSSVLREDVFDVLWVFR